MCKFKKSEGGIIGYGRGDPNNGQFGLEKEKTVRWREKYFKFGKS